MEPLDPTKNIDSGGFSKRRISSILKAPRKSTVICDPEQQENKVESTKAVEKRNSRRVSFAPANDVLLFAKDAKNSSPARSPLQELITATAAATQNRVQVVVTEDGGQQIMGIENLLSAPLHISQQIDMVSADVGNDGEQTVMFSTEDAVMDMTHSHTINIASDAQLLGDISLQNDDVILKGREQRGAVDGRSADMSLNHTGNITSTSGSLLTDRNADSSNTEKKNISAKVASMDPGFENFLASLSKTSSSSNAGITKRTPLSGSLSEETNFSLGVNKTPRDVVDKENLIPKSLNTTKKTVGPLQGGGFFPGDDVSMDITAAQTGPISETGDDDDPFQCLFPSEYMYARASQMAELKQQQGSETVGAVDLKENTLKNPAKNAHQKRVVSSSRQYECREKSILFSGDDEFMDMNQSHTVNIASGSVAPTQTQAKRSNPGFNEFLATLSKPSESSGNPDMHRMKPNSCSASKEAVDTVGTTWQHKTPKAGVDKYNQSLNSSWSSGEPFSGGVTSPDDDVNMQMTEVHAGGDVSMDITEAQTGNIRVLSEMDDPFQFFLPSQDLYPQSECLKKSKAAPGQQITTGFRSSTQKGLQMSLKSSLKTPLKRQENISTEEDYREKTVRFSADDACVLEGDVSMDMVQTSRIFETTGADYLASGGMYQQGYKPKKTETTSHLQSSGEPESSNSHGMEKLLKTSLQTTMQRQQIKLEVEDVSKDKTIRFSCDDACMDVTQSQTLNIVTNLPLLSKQNIDMPASGEKTVRFSPHDAAMDVTKSHTVNISTDLNLLSHQNLDYLTANGETTMRFTAKSAAMDMTRSLTVNIDTDLDTLPQKNEDLLPAVGEKTVRFSAFDAAMDVTKSHTVNISTDLNLLSHQNLDYLTANGEKTMRFTAKSAAMDMTRSLTVNIATDLDTLPQKNEDLLPAVGEKTVRFSAFDAAMDVTKSHTVNISTDLNLLSQKNLDYLTASEEKTTRFTAKSAAMDMTRSLTVNIATDLEALPQTNEDLLHAGGEKTVRFSTDDAAMDMTRSLTVNIATDLEALPQTNEDLLHASGEKTVRFSTDDAAMDVTRSHTVSIATDLVMETHQNEDLLLARGEKTVRFSAYDAAMDVTKSHTVNISTDLNLLSHQNLGVLSSNGEKTMRFTAKSAAMDMTRSLTVNIATDLDTLPQKNEDLLPAGGEKTVRFSTDDAAMDVTKSHTVNIATDLETLPQQPVDLLPASGKRTTRFAANDDAMDVIRSRSTTATHFETSNERTEAIAVSNTPRALAHDPTANNSTNVGRKPHQSADLVLPHGEKTVRFTTSDAAMEMTQSLTVNIASNSTFSLPDQTEERVKKSDSEADAPHLKVASSADSLDGKLKNLLAEASGPLDGQRAQLPHTPFPPETLVLADCQGQLKRPKSNTSAENEDPGLVSTFEKPVNKTVTDCSEISASMDMTEVQTGCILEQTYSDKPPESRSFDPVKKNGLSSRNTEPLGLSSPNALEITNPPHYPDSNETEATKPGPAACPVTQKLDSSPGVDTKSARTSRRMSLADLQSKVRRLSHMINAAPDETATDICTASLAQSDPDLEENPEARAPSLPGAEPEPEVSAGNGAEQPSEITPATPFNLKTKRLMSRLSVGGFKPKLPRRSNAEEAKKMTAAVSAANQLKELGNDVSDIDDEELDSCEDMSETLDGRCPDHVSAVELPSLEWDVFEPLKEDLFQEGRFGPIHRHKRPLPEDEVKKEDEKRLRACSEFVEPALQSDAADCERDVTTAQAATQNVDSSSHSHTASRCETAYESTTKHSLFESYLEDYNSDVQKKLEDGTITVLEFFKLFNIDFVIHNPRQSVVPGRILSDTDSTPMDLLKDRHISRPKQLVYDSDIQSLTERVEGLKVRMQDLDKHLKAVNRALWEEMRHSTEEEIKSFGAKLKERNNFFRKMSKVQSHEMKELLYSDLVQANKAEQQKLRGKIEEADVMIKSLDDCIGQLQAELTAVEEKGSEDKPSLKTLQEEMKRVTERLADSDRQITELEMQKKLNSSKLTRLKAETRNLENHVDVLNELNEWKFREKKDDCSVYSFLHETMLLQLVYEKSSGSDADIESEQKITSIAFKLELNDEKSQFHARLVHKLVSQYVEGEPAWVEKYPTSRHLPKLLHDISLVVSRCRLLGEELRLLKTWGALRLNILHIDCTGTRVHVVFSSLKTFSKFEVVFSVVLADQSYVLHVESFKNITGSTTIQQIEEIMTSFTPARNLLTRIIKKINNTLLC